MARGEDAFREAGIRVSAVAFLALVAAIVLAWAPLIPAAAALAGGLYAVELAIAGEGLRRAAFVALLGVAAFLVASVLLVLVDVVRARGLALDLLGAAAAAATLVVILLAARRGPSESADRQVADS